MKKVLIITHYFPPRPGIGSVRLGGLAKYLPEFGWHPIVLTSKLPYKPEGNFTLIETPAVEDTFSKWKRKIGFDEEKGFKEQIGSTKSIDSNTSKIANRIVELGKGIIAFPDSSFNWHGMACKYAEKIISEDHVDVLLSSSSPVTTHIIASSIKKKYGLPWLADLRDLWTQNHYYHYGSLRKLFERRLELRTLRRANALSTVSEPLGEKLKTLHGHDCVYTITNGFDPSDYEKRQPLTDDFTITYTGQLYEGKRDPRLFLSVMRELINGHRIDGSKVRIRFFGPRAPWLENFVKINGLENVVTFGQVDRKTALIRQSESCLLLLLNWDDPREQGVYTGKLFEYLGAKRPILSLGGSDGVVKDLLNTTNAGASCGSDSNLIRHYILSSYQHCMQNGYVPFNGNDEIIDKYSHKQMAHNFHHILNSFN